jgi:beta-glucosidase
MIVRLRLPSLLAACALGTAALCAADAPLTYLDPGQPQEVRIHDLISRMTLEEKVSEMANATPGVARLGIPKYNWWNEALHGVARAGHATVFPQAIGLAAMWDAPLQHDIASVIGTEARAKFNAARGTSDEGSIYHGLTFWSPNINIFRDPRWGRGQETYGEDPFLTAQLGVAFVRGLQGDNPNHLQAAACAKHFAVHSGPESLRHDFEAAPPEADLHETYLPAFEALVRQAHVEIVMMAYNSLYGTPCSIHPLLYAALEDWGFNGHVTSDCWSVTDLRQSYRRACCDADAQAMTVNAGMSVRCGDEPNELVDAVKRGLITEAMIDRRLVPLLRTMFRLGFFDPKDRVSFNAVPTTEFDTPAHAAVALRAARESIVLLKNNGVLPLDPAKLRRIAVIGPNATSVPALLGNYNGTPSAPVTILAGLEAALKSAGVAVDYAHGCDYAAQPIDARPISGSGWFRSEYFTNPEFSGEPVTVTYDPTLKFDFSPDVPKPATLPQGVPERGVCARWTGELTTTIGGDYGFVVHGRGGFRLKLHGQVVLDAWDAPAGAAAQERSFPLTRHLAENSTIPLVLEYRQGAGAVKVGVDWSSPPADAGEAEALVKARAADAIVFVGGISAQLEGEEMPVNYAGFSGGDRTSIELPELQRALLEKLRAVGKPVVLVNLSGSAVALPWADAHLDAIVQAWYPGQAGGSAVADVLLGHYNPGGRLPVTFYRATTDLPEFTDYRMAGRTYRYFGGKPLYAFGHGLSYTTFRYDDLHAAPAAGGTIAVTVKVTNTGSRDGDEVVQLYATPPAASRPREQRALCGFERVHLKAGETNAVRFTVPATALRRWNDADKAYYTPSGEWTLAVGASSADLRQTAAVKL